MSMPVTIEDGFAEYFHTRGNSMQLFFYEVPKLEYTNEDIKIEFSLTVKRGWNSDGLILAAALCERKDTFECINGID